MTNPTPTYDLCAIGNVCIDIIASVTDEFLLRHGMEKSRNNTIGASEAAALYRELPGAKFMPGGVGANVAHVIAALGGQSAFLGKAAQDVYAGQVTSDLQHRGIATSITTVADAHLQTSQVFCLITPEGERTFASYEGAAKTLNRADIDAKIVSASAITYLDSYTLISPNAPAALSRAMEISKTAERISCFNPCDVSLIRRSPSIMRDLAGQSAMLICNLDEATALFGSASLRDMGETLADNYEAGAITDGAAGAVVFAQGETLFIPPAETNSLSFLDSNGAGDHFAGGFLYGIIRNLSLEDAGRLGHLCAFDCLSHPGARPLGSLQHLVAALTKI